MTGRKPADAPYDVGVDTCSVVLLLSSVVLLLILGMYYCLFSVAPTEEPDDR